MDAAEWDARYMDTELLWTATANRFLVEEVGDLEPGRALDLACGEGRNAVWLAERGWTVTGVDFSHVALEKARKLAEARDVEVTWVLADVLTYNPEPEAFDLVVVLYLHLAEAEFTPVLGAAAGALAPGGTLLLVGHDRDNLERGHGGPQDPALLWSADEIVRDVPGLVVDKAGQAIRVVTTDEGDREAIDTLVRAHRPVGSTSPRLR